jgi:IS5 family transposase
MREARTTQPSLIGTWLPLEHSKELQTMSRLLDEHPTIEDLVLQDLRAATGRGVVGIGGPRGVSAEVALRALLIKQMNGFSYRELAFHLADSQTYRTFCRLGITDPTPSKSALAASTKAIRPETLEAIHRLLLGAPAAKKVEKANKVRVDCTVVVSDIHQPADSELLWDCVRVLTRLLRRARARLGSGEVVFANRTRRAKRRRREIFHARSAEQRQAPYRDLLKVSEEVVGWALDLRERLQDRSASDPVLAKLAEKLDRVLGLAEQVMAQTRRRVLEGQSVPAVEKIVSIFEDHTDIVRKDSRETLYGHKICLTSGASSLILDCVILEGNPADSTLAETMIDRQIEIYARPPRQAAFDGGFTSKNNLTALKAKGVEDVAFSKAGRLPLSAMARSTWVYKRLRDFRAGIEGNISFLKRAFGLDRCTWKSLPSFKSYVWSSILAFNLLVLARHLMT